MSNAWSHPGYEAVARLVGERTGLLFTPNLRAGVEARIREVMASHSIGDETRYAEVLAAEPSVFDSLVAALTVGETYFFREPGQFDYLRSTVLPELMARAPGRPLRVWSAGCASGEEAYSLAILLREVGGAGAGRVVGTDLSSDRLASARRACYSRWSLRGVPDAVVERYFTRVRNRYQLASEIRSAVRFQPLNLAEDSYPSLASGIRMMDLILCRNVLIYFDPSTVRQVARRLIASLDANGWLFLGASDPPLSDLVPCEVVVTGAGVAYRRARVARPPLRASAGPAPAPLRGEPPAPAAPAAHASPAKDPPDEESAAARYAARDYVRAAELSSAALELDPGDAAGWILLVRSLANQGRMAEAGRSCTVALEHHRTSAELMYLHAVLLAAAEHPAEAAAAARRALYLDRRLIVAHLLLGSLLPRLGDHEGAVRALRNAERLLAALPPDAEVPASDGERCRRLLKMTRLKLRLAEEAA